MAATIFVLEVAQGTTGAGNGDCTAYSVTKVTWESETWRLAGDRDEPAIVVEACRCWHWSYACSIQPKAALKEVIALLLPTQVALTPGARIGRRSPVSAIPDLIGTPLNSDGRREKRDPGSSPG